MIAEGDLVVEKAGFYYMVEVRLEKRNPVRTDVKSIGIYRGFIAQPDWPVYLAGVLITDSLNVFQVIPEGG